MHLYAGAPPVLPAVKRLGVNAGGITLVRAGMEYDIISKRTKFMVNRAAYATMG
jgi:hypothetical protein